MNTTFYKTLKEFFEKINIKEKLKNLGVYTSTLYVVSAICFLIQLFQLKIFESIHCLVVLIGIVLFALLIVYLLFKKNGKRFMRRMGNTLAIFLAIVLWVSSLGLYVVNSFISDLTRQSIERKDISLIVLEDSTISTVGDINETHTVGYQTICYPDSADRILKALKDEKGYENPKKEFETINGMVKGLYDKAVPIIILDEDYRKILETEWKTFTEDTRVVYTINYPERKMNSSDSLRISEESFVILISGIDTYGSISSVSRSDVNILAIVNPIRAKVLLVSVPRDYYVPIIKDGNSNGEAEAPMDKLTHAGLFGAQCTENTLEKLFDIPINYYVRVNFTSVVDIVDAIGGVTVENDYAFEGFPVGINECDGERALEFARERYAFIDGDRQRGRNHMKVIEAVVKKLSNPTLKYDYLQLYQIAKTSVETNLPDNDIKELIQLQLTKKPAWTVEKISVNGRDGRDYSYYEGKELYVMYPDQMSINEAKDQIRSVYFD